MGDNQRKWYSDYHKLKIVWRSSPEALTYGNATQMAKALICIFPPLPWTLTALFGQNSAFLVPKLMEYMDLGKEGITDICELHFGNPSLQQALGDSF